MDSVESLDIFIIKTKAGHDGLYDDMLKISYQLFALNFITRERLDNFVFNYGRYYSS